MNRGFQETNIWASKKKKKAWLAINTEINSLMINRVVFDLIHTFSSDNILKILISIKKLQDYKNKTAIVNADKRRISPQINKNQR